MIAADQAPGLVPDPDSDPDPDSERGLGHDSGHVPEQVNHHRVRRARRMASTAASVMLLGVFVAASAWFWPLRFGGSTTVVWVSGESMEPTLSNHDLVIARHHDRYAVGDVVVYRVPEGQFAAGTLVVHRIVGGDAVNGFVTRGDNRTTNDQWLPRGGDVLGEVVVQTQHGTLLHEVIESTTSSGGLGVLAGAVTAVAVFRSTRRRKDDSVKTVDQIEP